MKIRYINNDGAGFAGELELEEGTTVGQLFRDKMGSQVSALDYQIRCNGQIISACKVLKEGDRVSIVPKNLKGAH